MSAARWIEKVGNFRVRSQNRYERHHTWLLAVLRGVALDFQSCEAVKLGSRGAQTSRSPSARFSEVGGGAIWVRGQHIRGMHRSRCWSLTLPRRRPRVFRKGNRGTFWEIRNYELKIRNLGLQESAQYESCQSAQYERCRSAQYERCRSAQYERCPRCGLRCGLLWGLFCGLPHSPRQNLSGFGCSQCHDFSPPFRLCSIKSFCKSASDLD
jgi:hypothetical protein